MTPPTHRQRLRRNDGPSIAAYRLTPTTHGATSVRHAVSRSLRSSRPSPSRCDSSSAKRTWNRSRSPSSTTPGALTPNVEPAGRRATSSKPGYPWRASPIIAHAEWPPVAHRMTSAAAGPKPASDAGIRRCCSSDPRTPDAPFSGRPGVVAEFSAVEVRDNDWLMRGGAHRS